MQTPMRRLLHVWTLHGHARNADPGRQPSSSCARRGKDRACRLKVLNVRLQVRQRGSHLRHVPCNVSGLFILFFGPFSGAACAGRGELQPRPREGSARRGQTHEKAGGLLQTSLQVQRHPASLDKILELVRLPVCKCVHAGKLPLKRSCVWLRQVGLCGQRTIPEAESRRLE